MEELKKAEEAAEKYAIKTMKIVSNGMFDNVGRAEGFIAGAKWDRSQMMSEAVEGRVILRDMYDNRSLDIDFVLPDNLKIGNKVKVIIVKDD